MKLGSDVISLVATQIPDFLIPYHLHQHGGHVNFWGGNDSF
jgi:hypothetical protein